MMRQMLLGLTLSIIAGLKGWRAGDQCSLVPYQIHWACCGSGATYVQPVHVRTGEGASLPCSDQ